MERGLPPLNDLSTERLVFLWLEGFERDTDVDRDLLDELDLGLELDVGLELDLGRELALGCDTERDFGMDTEDGPLRVRALVG